jgi:hypothetical protein
MLPPLIQRAQRSGERGVTMPLVALSLVAILSFAALSIDLGALYEAKAEAQRAADAAALAAAQVISTEGVTGDPVNGGTDGDWVQICGGVNSFATLAAKNVANQNLIGGAPATLVNVYYGTSAGGVTNTDCTGVGTGFGINPVVSVYVQQANLPNFFARIFSFINNGTSSNSGVSATAFAEAFNPSNSGGGSVIPVQPRCVKPWMVPNLDPLHAVGCTTLCTGFVDLATGSIETPGVYTQNLGVIGERFWLVPDCGTVAPCGILSPPQANYATAGVLGADLQYLPGQAPLNTPVALASDGSTACAAVASAANNYAPAIAGCDQSTAYQCGVQGANTVDLSENPGLPLNSDTSNGVQCLIHQSTANISQLYGQDALQPTGTLTGGAAPYYPFQIEVGTSNPLIAAGVPNGSTITSSNNIVSLPIYDSTAVTTFGTGTTAVTIVGFLQVFINVVDGNGDAYVTVMNVSGCGNSASNPPVYGTSPVPVRLITPP